MQLTRDFSLEELTSTATGMPNKPGDAEFDALRLLAVNVLQPLRDLYGGAIIVNSGYRSTSVNISVGGSKTSQHLKGEAADLDCADNARLFGLIRNCLVFDQLIWEGGNDRQPDWVHVSFKQGANRRQVLRMRNGKYTAM